MARGFSSFAEQAASLPPHGSGKLNGAIYYSAKQGIAELLIPVQVYEVLYEAGLKAGRPASKLHREVWHAIESAVRNLSGADTDIGQVWTRRPNPDWARIGRVALANGKVRDLVRESKPVTMVLADVLDLWFRPGEWVCLVAAERDTASTRKVEEWKAMGLYYPELFVPNPMAAKHGRTREGTPSERALESVGPRRILPVEFDFSPKAGGECARMLEHMQECGYSVKDLNVALHLHLQTMVPLGAAVDSGGKSVHGHYPCAHLSDEDLRMFMDYALVLTGSPRPCGAGSSSRP